MIGLAGGVGTENAVIRCRNLTFVQSLLVGTTEIIAWQHSPTSHPYKNSIPRPKNILFPSEQIGVASRLYLESAIKGSSLRALKNI